MSQYRRIRVDIYPGKAQTMVAVVAQVVQGAQRRDRLVYRAAVDNVSSDTAAALLRVAADELHSAADRLM